MRYFAIRLVLLLTACGVLSACTMPYDPSDMGTTPCRQWTSEHSAKSPQAETLNKWIFDYFRTHDLEIQSKDNWVRGVYTESSIVRFTSAACEIHPRRTIEETAKSLVKGAHQTMVEAVLSAPL